MPKQTFTVSRISCGHCVAAIKNELEELEGVRSIEGDPAHKNITVEWDAPATVEQIRNTLLEINYPAD